MDACDARPSMMAVHRTPWPWKSLVAQAAGLRHHECERHRLMRIYLVATSHDRASWRSCNGLRWPNPKSEIQSPATQLGRGESPNPSPKIRVRSSAEGGGGGSLEIVEIVSGARYLMSSKSQVRNPTWPLVIVKHLRNPEFPNPKSKMSAEGRKVPLNPESPNPKSDTPPER